MDACASVGIRRLRERLTQKQLANLAQVSQSAVSLAECGSPLISQETKDKIQLACMLLLHEELLSLAQSFEEGIAVSA
jgi:transcriptional regulator with XRE-family HTH domain